MRLVAIGALAIFAGLFAPRVDAQKGGTAEAFIVTPDMVAPKYRMFAEAGDLALKNSVVTAVVRKSDGWLVDFFPNSPRPPSSPQLKRYKSVDGLWFLRSYVHDGRLPKSLFAKVVRTKGQEIETVGELRLGAGVLEVTTSYRLAGDQPRLVITSNYKHKSGGSVSRLWLADRLKWGNTDYFVDGVRKTRPTFAGSGRWVGRRGASGDLKLETLGSKKMQIGFQRLFYGLAPAIEVKYARATIAPGETAVVQRALTYETISTAQVPQKPEGLLEATLTDENGRQLAAKLTFRGIEGTRNPNFGNDGDETGVNRFAWSGLGEFKRKLPVGRYNVLATSGIERDAATWDVTIENGVTTRVAGKLPRVIETPGQISADLHLHQAPSVDADVACSSRVISVAAEGLEFAVATDHYAITDLQPTVDYLIKAGQLASRVLTLPGTEVSTTENLFGHFNLYPTPLDAKIDYSDTTPKQLFAEMRKAAPGAILQVNHPRWSVIGYFHRYRMDPTSGRIPATFKDEYDPDFDAIEIFNGLDATMEPRIRQVIADWTHLLGQGRRYTATGNSDSHKLAFHDPGLPRNLIRYGTAKTDADDLDADPAAVIRAVKDGHVTVTSGPVVDISIDGVGPGGTVRGKGKRVKLYIRVRAAPWIDVREVEVLLGSQGNRVRWIPIKPTKDVVRYEKTIEIVAPGNTFVIVLAKGVRALPNVFMPETKPFAFTNPIFIEP